MHRTPHESFSNSSFNYDDFEAIRNHLLQFCWHERQNSLAQRRHKLLQDEFQGGTAYGYMVGMPRLHHQFEEEDREAMVDMAEEVRSLVGAVIFYGEDDAVREMYTVTLEVWEGGWLKSPRSSGAIWYQQRYSSWIGISHIALQMDVAHMWEVRKAKMAAAALKEVRDSVVKNRLVPTLLPAEVYGQAFDTRTGRPTSWISQ